MNCSEWFSYQYTENSVEPGIIEEFQENHGVLRECIEQLKLAESSRGNLLSLLREALNEQVAELITFAYIEFFLKFFVLFFFQV